MKLCHVSHDAELVGEVVEQEQEDSQCSSVQSDKDRELYREERERERSDLWTGFANSAFLRKGERNLKSAVRSWAYIGQPFFCRGVRDRIRLMKTR